MLLGKETMRCVLSQVMALLLWLLAPLFLFGPALELPVPCCHSSGCCAAVPHGQTAHVAENPVDDSESCSTLEPHHHHHRSLSLLDDAGRRTAPTALPKGLGMPPEAVFGQLHAFSVALVGASCDRVGCLPRSAVCRPLRC